MNDPRPCLACEECDDRTRLGGVWCLSCFALPLEDRIAAAILYERQQEAVEGHYKAA